MGFIRKHPILVMRVALTAIFLFLGLSRAGLLETLDLKIYDAMMKMRGSPESPSQVVIVDIDDDSIEKLGRWPWPRSLVANGIEKISTGNPKTIGLNFIFSEPEQSAGLNAVEELESLFSSTLLEETGDRGQSYLTAIEKIRHRLDSDTILVNALQKAGNVVLPVFFRPSVIVGGGREEGELDRLLAAHSVTVQSTPDGFGPPVAGEIILPIPKLMKSAAGVGHINLAYDSDGTARREQTVYRYKNLNIPSYTLRLAAAFMDVPTNGVQVEVGDAVRLKGLSIPITASSELLVNFKGPSGVFKRYAFYDLVNDKIPPAVFKNKLVLVSASASGIINPLSTPTDASMPLGDFSANALDSVIQGRFIRQPQWGPAAELALIFLMGCAVTFLFPGLKAKSAGITFWILLTGLAVGSVVLFVLNGTWLRVTAPLLLLIIGYIGVLSVRFFVTETGKEKAEGESAETNRMLGLSFQSQGMLDMAFDKFRRVPIDDGMKEILYNLALDFERKRQFNKAASVYEHIQEVDYDYKDIKNRKSRLLQASETMVFGTGGIGGAPANNDLIGTASDIRPTLGRYEVIKQLGQGAMGIVYLGKDPRINRTTAIKTFRFIEDVDEDQKKKMKEKFFREAESAGTLSHPNIVTIYDAGEEQELAYIAMEYLEGEDLEKYTKKENLLPIRKVIDFIADISDALDYAHQRGIVHRDIKPANIMLLTSGIVKITDFGIARITATSQTQTGVIKGTPYYMSPEQFSGEKVDGRSDIFSLGTMMYQLLTAKLPFYGDSPASLMNKIMNVPHQDPREINSRIYRPLVTILDKALQKDKSKRYQKASSMAGHLRTLGKKVDALAARKKGIN